MTKRLTREQLERVEKISTGKMSNELLEVVVRTIFPSSEWERSTFGTKETLKKMEKMKLKEYKDRNGDTYFSP